MQPIINGVKILHIQANTFICRIKDKTCQYGKVIATGKFVNQVIKETGFKVGIVSFTGLKKTCQYKKLYR